MQKSSWDRTFITMCYLMAHRSGDHSSHIGATIVGADKAVVSVGYNDLPRGIEDDNPARRSSENGAKYKWTEHSERNAIYNAGRNGVPLLGCSLYVNLLPCSDCARAIIQSGISEVICHREGHDAFYKTRGDGSNVWLDDHRMVIDMLIDGGVRFKWWSGTLIQPRAFFSGQEIVL